VSSCDKPRPTEPSRPREPDPLSDDPPADRFCDLVLNGGVASGVVYPWALVELARHYRFRNIGGNSVGAMAAAMAAAAEYGRCVGVEDAFEPLRRFPLELAKEVGGQPLMLRLFQPSAKVRRLFKVFLLVVRASEGGENMAPAARPHGPAWLVLATLYGLWFPLGVGLLLVALATLVNHWHGSDGTTQVMAAVLLALGVVGVVVAIGLRRIWQDVRALADNDFGLCRGGSQDGRSEALVEWLHRGIQCSAGRGERDPPLTFADLWAAPRFGRAGPTPAPGGLQPADASIGLQMFSSNVTQGRPIRLPLNDANTRLYYLPEEWELLFPKTVMDALERASAPYAPASSSDPGIDTTVGLHLGPDAILVTRLRALPSGGMPLVVAARMSLCFPILFSCVPVYAVDYECERPKRALRRCLLSDGGLCSNFPVHLFDAAHPRWPTFAMLLDKRLQSYDKNPVWLPETNLEGRADNWLRSVPGAETREDDDKHKCKCPDGSERKADKAPLAQKPRSALSRLGAVVVGMLVTTKDWNDRVTGRLPTVRNRIVHLALQRGEGQLNIAMPGSTMLRMASEYGLGSAQLLIKQFAPKDDGAVTQGWRDHLYVRAVVELRALRVHLRHYGEAVRGRGDTLPLRELLDQVTTKRPLTLAELLGDTTQPRPLAKPDDRVDPAGDPLVPQQRDALLRAVLAVESLETELANCEAQFGPYVPVLAPELRLRPPI
jgi:predicted acylesterase/phospholipase RssA